MLAGAPHYDLAWLIVAILLLLAFVPIVLAVATTRVGGDAAERGRAGRVMLALRLWLEHEPRGHAQACAGGRSRSASRRWPNYRFLITADGYASVAPLRAKTVYGVLWRLTPRDCVTLAAWENVAGGALSRGDAAGAPGAAGGASALVYLARPRARRRRHRPAIWNL